MQTFDHNGMWRYDFQRVDKGAIIILLMQVSPLCQCKSGLKENVSLISPCGSFHCGFCCHQHKALSHANGLSYR